MHRVIDRRPDQAIALALLMGTLSAALTSCQSAPLPEETGTNAPIVMNTAQVYETTPALTIVEPEGTHPDNSAFIQVTENNLNVTQVAAEDIPGSTLTYRLQDGEDQDKFSLDEDTGTLKFKDLPDWEQPQDADANNHYMLLWQVVSSSGEARSQFVVVQVTDLPEPE